MIDLLFPTACKCYKGAALLPMRILLVCVRYLVSFKFYPRVDMPLCHVGYLLQGFQRCQNSLNEDFAFRRMGPTSEAQVCSSGREGLSAPEEPSGHAGCFALCFFCKGGFKTIWWNHTQQKHALKICIYAWETHFPRVVSGYT